MGMGRTRGPPGSLHWATEPSYSITTNDEQCQHGRGEAVQGEKFTPVIVPGGVAQSASPYRAATAFSGVTVAICARAVRGARASMKGSRNTSPLA